MLVTISVCFELPDGINSHACVIEKGLQAGNFRLIHAYVRRDGACLCGDGNVA
jgi:hypothetical protein